MKSVKRFLLISVLLIGAGCKQNEANTVEHNEPNIIEKNKPLIFEWNKIAVGQKFGEMTVVEISSVSQMSESDIMVRFSGKVQISGRFKTFGKTEEGHDFFGGIVQVFDVDESSAWLLPQQYIERNPSFIFRGDLTPFVKDGIAIDQGQATIVIDNYQNTYYPSEGFDHVDLIKIVQMQETKIAE